MRQIQVFIYQNSHIVPLGNAPVFSQHDTNSHAKEPALSSALRGFQIDSPQSWPRSESFFYGDIVLLDSERALL